MQIVGSIKIVKVLNLPFMFHKECVHYLNKVFTKMTVPMCHITTVEINTQHIANEEKYWKN